MSFDPPPLPPTQPQWGAFQVWWQQVIDSLKTTFGDIAAVDAALADQLAQINAAQAAADAAQTTATTAQTAATTAQGTADTAKTNDSISSSWTSPGSILSAADAGTNVTVTIANHTRKYGDATSALVTGGTITALAYSTTYYIYYDQLSRAGGTVSYQATTNPNTALANASAGRHFCGEVPTPASGGPPSSGGVSPPSGGGGIPDTDVP